MKSLNGFGKTKRPEESLIDWGKVPDVNKEILAAALLPRIQAFFDDPENVRGFEEWKKRRANNGRR